MLIGKVRDLLVLTRCIFGEICKFEKQPVPEPTSKAVYLTFAREHFLGARTRTEIGTRTEMETGTGAGTGTSIERKVERKYNLEICEVVIGAGWKTQEGDDANE